jgi:D-alanyl-lipoteichoic acid acyltransferase DltB (MBOAT superfamily)
LLDGFEQFAAARPTTAPVLLLIPLLPTFFVMPRAWVGGWFVVTGLLLTAAVGGPLLAAGLLAATLLGYAATETIARRIGYRAGVFVVWLAVLHAAYWACFWLPIPDGFQQLPEPADRAPIFILFSGIGLTFFRLVGYTFERLYKGVPAMPLARFLPYMFYYPQLRHGPLEKPFAFAADVSKARSRWRFVDFGYGLVRIGWVVVVLAVVGQVEHILAWFGLREGWQAITAAFADRQRVFAEPERFATGTLVWVVVLAPVVFYLLESVFTHLVLATGRLCGIRGSENYHYPFLSLSIWEIWKRWNITLGTWLHSYALTPMTHAGVPTRYGTILLFVYCGLLHGLQVRSLVWGLFVGISMTLVREVQLAIGWRKRWQRMSAGQRYVVGGLCWLATMHWATISVIIILDPHYCGTRIVPAFFRRLGDVIGGWFG